MTGVGRITDDEVLIILQKIDKEYVPTAQEKEVLAKIRKVNLSDHGLTSLPKSICLLQGLTSLQLSANHLTSLPDSICNLTKLSNLNISKNKLTNIPKDIGNLKGLTQLNISGNNLTTLPDSICKLTNLARMNLRANNLIQLPEGVGNLSGLSSLDLSKNQLIRIPDSIGELTCLSHLFIGSNYLTNLPESMRGLTNLTNLHIGDNRLADLPEWIGCLTKLKRLNLYKTYLTCLPESIGNLTALTSLNISRCFLNELPDSMGNLERLTKLYLSGNSLNRLPEWIVKLKRLTHLNLSWTKLTTIPDSIGDLKSLKSLWIRDLTLDRLPEALLNLNLPFYYDEKIGYNKPHKEFGISLHGTSLALQPISLFDQAHDQSPDHMASRKLIEEYFHADHIAIRESKVILLGDAGAGKTYTVKRLLNDCKKGNYQTEQTQGILIEELHHIKQVNGKDYTIRIWDFGGQDIMNEMHRCFLTERTCYVVLIDTRNNCQTEKARKWLRTVSSVASNAPVLLVVNEFSGSANRDLDATSLLKEFHNLKQVRYCSSKDSEENEFRRDVEVPLLNLALSMDSCKMTLPESWEKVRMELLSMREKKYYIDRATFHNICDDYGIPKDEQLRVWLLNWFNDMGVCFSYHFKDGEERKADYKILEPKWLTSAIYRLIWEKEQNDDGIITRFEIESILKREGSEDRMRKGIPCLLGVKYKPKECEYVLEIMRKFCISYRVNDREEFMPTLCKPDSKLEIRQEGKPSPAPDQIIERISIQFRYNLLPEKVIHELMIYCYQYLTRGRMWRKGFWLENTEQGLYAVVYTPEEKYAADTLQIDVYTTKTFFNVAHWLQPLCKKIREINNRTNLKAEEWILAENRNGSDWYELENVWFFYKEGDLRLTGSRNRYEIKPLLSLAYGQWLSAARKDHDLPDIEKDESPIYQRESELEKQVPELIEAIRENTAAHKENTEVYRQQLFSLLDRIESGDYGPKKEILEKIENIILSMDSFRESFENSQQPTLSGRIRAVLEVCANGTEIGIVLAKLVSVLHLI